MWFKLLLKLQSYNLSFAWKVEFISSIFEICWMHGYMLSDLFIFRRCSFLWQQIQMYLFIWTLLFRKELNETNRFLYKTESFFTPYFLYLLWWLSMTWDNMRCVIFRFKIFLNSFSKYVVLCYKVSICSPSCWWKLVG